MLRIGASDLKKVSRGVVECERCVFAQQDYYAGMTSILTLSAAVLMYGVSGSAVAQSAPQASEKPTQGQISALQDAPKSPPKAAPKPDASKYPGFAPLVQANREAFVKLVKKRNELKAQNPPQESTFEEYKKLDAEYQKASSKVSEFMANKRWTDEDRAAMTTIVSDELSKAVS